MVLQYVRMLEAQNPDLGPHGILNLFQNNMCWSWMKGFPSAALLGMIDGPPEKPIAWGYVYTERHGWIDLGHFLTMARAGAQYPNSKKLLELLGKAYEDYTEQAGKEDPTKPGMGSSANTPEDMVSNTLGIEFGTTLRSDMPLSRQLQQFFDESGAKPPTEAWNFGFLPRSEAVWELCWQNFPEVAMKRLGIVLDRDHSFWKKFPPNSPEVQFRGRIDDIWGPLEHPRLDLPSEEW